MPLGSVIAVVFSTFWAAYHQWIGLVAVAFLSTTTGWWIGHWSCARARNCPLRVGVWRSVPRLSVVRSREVEQGRKNWWANVLNRAKNSHDDHRQRSGSSTG